MPITFHRIKDAGKRQGVEGVAGAVVGLAKALT